MLCKTIILHCTLYATLGRVTRQSVTDLNLSRRNTLSGKRLFESNKVEFSFKHFHTYITFVSFILSYTVIHRFGLGLKGKPLVENL